MKHIPLHFMLAILLLIATDTGAQEIKVNENGLIYDAPAMVALHQVVDSLNLKFKSCDPNPNFKSIPTVYGKHVHFQGEKCKTVLALVENGMTFDQLMTRFPDADVKDEALLMECEITPQNELWLSSSSVFDRYSNHLATKKMSSSNESILNSWAINYSTDYSVEALTLIWITTEINQSSIPQEYALKIQYSECLLDTSGSIYSPHAVSRFARNEEGVFDGPHVKAFFDQMSAFEEPKPEGFFKSLDWEDKRFEWMQKNIEIDQQFQDLLAAAVHEATLECKGIAALTPYVETYGNKEQQLAMKRCMIVRGSCSMDNAPRQHAQQIAMLAAQTTNWEVFLRSHLNIMNDRFARASDGSYAYAKRLTYIKELEELDIDVHSLLIGICLRADNLGEGHYYGSINRIGRALAETNDPEALELQLENMLQNEELDITNRALMYYLYCSYAYNQTDPSKKEALMNRANALAKDHFTTKQYAQLYSAYN